MGNCVLNSKINKKFSILVDRINTTKSTIYKDFKVNKENYEKLKSFYVEDIKTLSEETKNMSFVKNYIDS